MFALVVEDSQMRILAVNLDKAESDAITSELGEFICAVNCLEQACELVQKEDFTTIVYRITNGSPDLKGITNLVGLTLISARILLIGRSDLLARRNDWLGLGVEFLPSPTISRLIHGIQECASPPCEVGIIQKFEL